MNDIHSKPEWIYRPRWITSLLRAAAQDHPVVVLTGARQVGKSTLLQREKPFSQWRYISLDDLGCHVPAIRTQCSPTNPDPPQQMLFFESIS